MDFDNPLLLFFLLSSGGGGGGLFGAAVDVGSHNSVPVAFPVALAVGSLSVDGNTITGNTILPPGVPKDRRFNLDRRSQPHPGRRRGDSPFNMPLYG